MDPLAPMRALCVTAMLLLHVTAQSYSGAYFSGQGDTDFLQVRL